MAYLDAQKTYSVSRLWAVMGLGMEATVDGVLSGLVLSTEHSSSGYQGPSDSFGVCLRLVGSLPPQLSLLSFGVEDESTREEARLSLKSFLEKRQTGSGIQGSS